MNLREEQQYMLGLLKNDAQDEGADGLLMEKLGLQRKLLSGGAVFNLNIGSFSPRNC